MHDARDHVRAVRRDILIENNEISKISSIIRDCADADIIDCHMKIISPGFVDTHHHLWQTQLKGRHGNEVLLEYMASGNLQSSNYTKEDIYWGQLGGCLESINAGTTAVVDHSHINCFPGAGKSCKKFGAAIHYSKTKISYSFSSNGHFSNRVLWAALYLWILSDSSSRLLVAIHAGSRRPRPLGHEKPGGSGQESTFW